jgi:hypothetical protein
MNWHIMKHLKVGDRVGFSDSSVQAAGVITEDLGLDYVRVRWFDCLTATTHRRYALEETRPELRAAQDLNRWT